MDLKIFVVKDETPEMFCIALESSGKFTGEMGRVLFFTEKQLRDALQNLGLNPNEINIAIEEARKIQR